jgi:hypothetical protein
MAKYEITRNCGHTETHQITGNSRDREWRIKWLERHDCGACFGAKRVEASKAEGAAALVALGDTASKLPTLTGSEKQVTWATQIRAKVFTWLASDEAGRAMNGLDAVARFALTQVTAAGWYCDRGRVSPAETARAAIGWWLVGARVPALGAVAHDGAAWLVGEALVELGESDPHPINSRGIARAWTRLLEECLIAWQRTRSPGREPGEARARDLAAEGWDALRAEWALACDGSGIEVALPETIAEALTPAVTTASTAAVAS